MAFVVRALPLTAARPYIAYIDEGYAIHPAARMIRDRVWDPGSYNYPQFPMVAVTAATRVLDPAYRLLKGRSLRDRIPANPVLYDDLEPFPLLFLGRALCLVLGMGIVVLTGLLAKRLGGPAAGAAAVLVAALTPALVLRGPIATVDPYAAFFVLACVLLTDISRTAARPGRSCFAAGVLAGFAFASKYPAVLVFLVLATATVLLPISAVQKLKRLGLGAVGLLLGVVAGMPAVLTNPAGVVAAFRFQRSFYERLRLCAHLGPGLGAGGVGPRLSRARARGGIRLLCARGGRRRLAFPHVAPDARRLLRLRRCLVASSSPRPPSSRFAISCRSSRWRASRLPWPSPRFDGVFRSQAGPALS